MFGLSPDRVAFTAGPVEISWYGIFATAALAVAYTVAYHVWKRSKDPTESIRYFDRIFLVVFLAGVIGARVLFVLYHLDYFARAPFEVFELWRGGWVWQGGLITGASTLFFAVKTNVRQFFRFADILAPALALAQGIGRWGNYFNQEAYGLPTNGWWAIPIDFAHRVSGYESFATFHPTFLYESVVDLALFIILLALSLRKNTLAPRVIAALYIIIYSAVRFGIEFLRIDTVPVYLGFRAPQWMSLALVCCGMWILMLAKRCRT